MKIAIVGPCYPLRGGIAHHTGQLAKHLRKSGDEVDLVSFSRQYPALLYPGASQEEGHDDHVDEESIRPSERLIDSVNPLTWFRTGRVLSSRRYDLIIFRHWIPFFAPCFGVIGRVLRRREKRRQILVICDNLEPHEARMGDRILSSFFLSICDYAITQSLTVSRQWKRCFPKIPERMLPHPVYDHFGPLRNKGDARRSLGLSARRIILFFGFVREYKGVDILIEAMKDVARTVPDAHLFIVGEILRNAAMYYKLVETMGVSDKVTFVNRYVPGSAVSEWFSAADCIVLPYRTATNSGVLQVAVHYGLPAVVSKAGDMPDVLNGGRAGVVVENNTPADLSAAVVKLLKSDAPGQFAKELALSRGRYQWDGFVKGIHELVGGSN